MVFKTYNGDLLLSLQIKRVWSHVAIDKENSDHFTKEVHAGKTFKD